MLGNTRMWPSSCPDWGHWSGRVLAADGVTPLPNAEIGVESLTQFGMRRMVRSDASGAYAVGGIPVGNFSIVAVHQPSQSQLVLAGNIGTAGAVVNQDLILFPVNRPDIPPPGSVSGRVLRADGVTSASGVQVFTDKGGLTTSDDQGLYRIEGLTPGGVKVQAYDDQRQETATVNTTILAGATVNADLLLFGGFGTVRGFVLDADGRPVAGAQIGGGLQIVESAADGSFVLPDVPLGKRSLQALVPGTRLFASHVVYLTQPGEEVTTRLLLPAAGTLLGRVTRADGTTPVANLEIVATGSGAYFATTDANGAYRMENVLAGQYQISAFLPNFSDGNVAKDAHRQQRPTGARRRALQRRGPGAGAASGR